MTELKTITLAAAALFGLTLLMPSQSVEAADAKEKSMKSRVVADQLDNPSGVAVHPKTGHVFFAARDGVHRLVPGKTGKVYPEITSYPTDVYGKGPKYNIGPLGVGFLGNDHLVVGDGSRPDGEELVRVYKISADPATQPVGEDSAEFTLGPIEQGEDSAKGEGNFYGVAVNKAGIFITANGDDTKGWILKAEVKNGKPQALKAAIATKVATGVDAPVAITNGENGEIVVGQMGEMNVPGDSLLTVYNAKSGELLSSYETGLSDIAGLAFSPKTGKLYAADFSWAKPEDGGLFELITDGKEVTVKKVMSLDKPTALAFDKRGRLYITVFGSTEEGSEENAGQLLIVPAGL